MKGCGVGHVGRFTPEAAVPLGGGAVGGAEMKLTVREARSNCFERLFALSTLNGIAFAYFHSKHTTEVFELLFYR